MDTGEFGLGKAPPTSKPINKIELSKAKEEEIAKMQEDDEEHERSDMQEEDESKMEIIRLKKQRDKKRKPIDRQTAFIEYKGI